MTTPAHKLILVGRGPGDPAAFQAQVHTAAYGADSPFLGAARTSVCRIGPRPEGLPMRPDDPADPRPPYDAAVFALFDDVAAADAALDRAVADPRFGADGTRHGFRVQEWPVLERLAPGPLPGLKMVALLAFHDDLPESAVRRSWALHANLAERVHLGAGRYVRNWIERRAGDGVPEVGGIAEIDFAIEADLVERYFDSERGKAEIIQDTGHFIRHPTRLYMREEPQPGAAP